MAILIAGQAVEARGADLLGAPAGVDGQLDTGAHLGRGQRVQVRTDLPHDLRRQIPARFGGLGFGGDVLDAEGEVLTQAGGDTAWPGQPHRPDAGEHGAHLAAGPDPRVTADLPSRFQIGQQPGG